MKPSGASPALVQAPEALPALAPAAATRPSSEKASSGLRGLYERAAQREASMDSYILRLRRREVVGSSKRPEELILFKFRRQPWSVYLKWLGEEGKGREVVFVKGKYGDVIHTLTAAWDIPLVPAGKRIKVAPDSMLVRSKSRYPITEAGFTPLVQRFGRMVAAIEKGDTREGSAKHLGLLKRPEFETQVDCVLQTLPPRSDPLLPRGGQRLWFFDPAWHLPVLIITQDETGREVEYYCHDRIQFPVRLDDADFDPDRLWKTGT